MDRQIFCIIINLLEAVFMLSLGLFFYKSNGSATNFLTGYNMRTDEERKKYDEKAMCKSYGKQMMIMAIPFLVGAVIDFFVSGAGTKIAWACWIILFIRLIIDRLKREK